MSTMQQKIFAVTMKQVIKNFVGNQRQKKEVGVKEKFQQTLI